MRKEAIVKRSILVMLLILSGCTSPRDLKYKTITQYTKREFSSKFTEGEIGRFSLSPLSRESEQEGINIRVTYMDKQRLEKFFSDTSIFGKKEKNPYPPETLVFNVRISNNGTRPIKISPEHFIVLDDSHGQYENIMGYYLVGPRGLAQKAYYVSNAGDEYAPGYYGVPFKIAKFFFQKTTDKEKELMEKVALRGGYIYPNVKYEGHLFFIKPEPEVHSLRLILPYIQTEFDYNSQATHAIQFVFPFEVNCGDGCVTVPPTEK